MRSGALLSTPRGRLRHDLPELSRTGRKLPSWAPSPAEGDGDAVAHLAQALRTYIRIALAPWWNGISTRLDAERPLHYRFLTKGHLDGRGLLVPPSHFCWRHPTLLKDPALPVAAVYPMAHDTAVGRTTRPRPSLGALLGQTRTEVLESLAEHHGMTTTELAQGVGIHRPRPSPRGRTARGGPAHPHTTGTGITGWLVGRALDVGDALAEACRRLSGGSTARPVVGSRSGCSTLRPRPTGHPRRRRTRPSPGRGKQ